jgi:hypothetical protein
MRTFKVAILVAVVIGACVSQPPAGQAGPTEATDVEQTSAALYVKPEFIQDPPVPWGSPTPCNGMHCCPDGYAMQGAYLSQNMFRCVRVATINPAGAEDAYCYVDGLGYTAYTIRNGMHTCALGAYMKGLHVDSNLLTCCGPPAPLISAEYVDGDDEPPTQYTSAAYGNASVHTCAPFVQGSGPGGASGAGGATADEWVMTGIRVDANYFNCGH